LTNKTSEKSLSFALKPRKWISIEKEFFGKKKFLRDYKRNGMNRFIMFILQYLQIETLCGEEVGEI
jgi:hypothetical protein